MKITSNNSEHCQRIYQEMSTIYLSLKNWRNKIFGEEQINSQSSKYLYLKPRFKNVHKSL